MRASNSAGGIAANFRLKRSTIVPSIPALAMRPSFSTRLDSRAGASPGAKNSRGRGSNVTAALARLRSRAARTTCASIAWCPRCTPSKLPMASATSPAGPAWRRIFTRSLVVREIARPQAHEPQGREVRGGSREYHPRELRRARRRRNLEPRRFAPHGIPQGPAHHVERDHELEEESSPSRLRDVGARAAHEPPEPCRVETGAHGDRERQAGMLEERDE